MVRFSDGNIYIYKRTIFKLRVMYVEQIFTACLAEMAYYIESNGEAVIIDPLRETTPYLEMAEKREIIFLFFWRKFEIRTSIVTF